MTDSLPLPRRPQLSLLPDTYSDISTIGNLLIYGSFFCNTLEDTVRTGADKIMQVSEKVPGKTAIPAGIYPIELKISPKFGYCPFVLNVPFFSDIRIHWGNKAEHTDGCILVGRKTDQPDFIGDSQNTFIRLMDELVAIKKREQIYLEICGRL